MASVGKIIRFDDVRGYGFIAPSGGGEDIFVHANDFGEHRHLVRLGLPVEYEAVEGDRGLKAASVRIIEPIGSSDATTNGIERRPRVRIEGDEEMCDVLAPAEFTSAITEVLLRCSPSLTGAQIIDIRERFVEFSRAHGWVDG
ncbi:cold-shock protein [Micromonospora endophytica]|uniref:DNA-binding protein n=1 Tax=Micromonospora endophytica TaxID=515350 RepID=A0A2W2CMI5_9ACTN|nr:cold shock domain-containing protein [Micromonospora endophytica]PZG00722.1 DNA-binding protein [Micromonospora endophytica]RIW44843.1 cold shock domain-containing protein [Micromonospora endophytica]